MAGLPSDHLSESTSAAGVEEVGAVLDNTLAGVAMHEGVMKDQSFEPGPNVRAWLLFTCFCLAVCSLAWSAACFSASLAAHSVALMAAHFITARCLARAAVHFVTLTNPDGFSILEMTL